MSIKLKPILYSLALLPLVGCGTATDETTSLKQEYTWITDEVKENWKRRYPGYYPTIKPGNAIVPLLHGLPSRTYRGVIQGTNQKCSVHVSGIEEGAVFHVVRDAEGIWRERQAFAVLRTFASSNNNWQEETTTDFTVASWDSRGNRLNRLPWIDGPIDIPVNWDSSTTVTLHNDTSAVTGAGEFGAPQANLDKVEIRTRFRTLGFPNTTHLVCDVDMSSDHSSD